MSPCVLAFVVCWVAASASTERHVRTEEDASSFLQFHWDFKSKAMNLTALREFEAWDHEQGWTALHRLGVNYSDLTAWPPMSAHKNGWDTGLMNPKVTVVSMRQRISRRQSFMRQFESMGWNLGAEWAAAMDGSVMPERLRWLKGYVDTQAWDHDKPGNWGCYLSHLAVLREAQAKYPDSDVMVFEDDAVFTPRFQERWNSFFAAVPKDWSIVRLGAQSLWEPSFEATAHYVRAKAVANTWGYVVRASAVSRLADLLAELPVRGSWGVDAVMQLFTAELKTYVPAVPLVYAVGSCSDSSSELPGKGCAADEEADLQRRIMRLHASWPQGYVRAYCEGKGTLLASYRQYRLHEQLAEGCKDLSSDTCCPYKNPPTLPM
jgi:GR25 family glycosyltransferase involved in LPS biosynthesis